MTKSAGRSEGDLRSRVASILSTSHTQARLLGICDDYGMPGAADEPDESRTKHQYVMFRLSPLSFKQFLTVAEKILEDRPQIELQEEVYELLDKDMPPLTVITRREVVACYGDEIPSADTPLLAFLRRFWPIDAGILFSNDTPAAAIHQHAVKNPDWNTADILQYLGAESWSRRRFLKLIEATIAPDVRRGAAQDQLVALLRPVLERDGWQIMLDGDVSGYPSYKIVPRASGVSALPKNLIFASIGLKPELGFSDAVSNDVVILENADSCLIYDRPFRNHGLLWDELVDWWGAHPEGKADSDTAKSLAKRLWPSLDSLGEKNLFKEYFRTMKPRMKGALPALIPQVYLHYDPKTVRQLRGVKRIPRQRMDFLLLLPHHVRIVLEVDGKHHYAEGETASINRYAEMVSEDRKLRLQGYELYRFGANELVGAEGKVLIQTFFEALFEKHRLRSETD